MQRPPWRLAPAAGEGLPGWVLKRDTSIQVEDITKDVGSLKRLLAAFLSAAIAWWLLGGVSRVGVSWADWVLGFWPISLLFTMIAVGGCTHALNIIDGMNGLAGMIATLMALSLALVALQVQDIPIFLIGNIGRPPI